MGKNQEIARIFFEMADILEMKEVEWKPHAFRKAGRNIETLSKNVEDVYNKGGLKALMGIPGVGERLAEKIEEYIKTGKIKEYEKLRKTIPSGLEEMMRVQGMGPKTVWKLYKKFGIDNLDKLEKAAKSGRIRKIPGFGEKSEEDILVSVGLFKKGQERMLLGMAWPIAQEMVSRLKKLKEVDRIEIAGSLRRKKETIGDIDILVESKKPEKVMDMFTTMPNVQVVQAKGKTKSSVRLKEKMDSDIRVLDKKSFGAGLLYFIGNKEHNIALRRIAIKKGYKLSEYGLFDLKGNFIAGKTEQDVYKKLDLKYMEPELRQNTGEIEAAQSNKLPKLAGYKSIKGDLHIHTKWSDGAYSTEDVIKACIKMGYKYMAITDHSKSQRIANGLDEKKLLNHIKDIEKLQKKYPQIKILKGSEVDILPTGKLDYSDKILKKLDIVVVSIHSRFKSEKEEMTKRVLKAMDNPNMNILGHPTGRLINQRKAYEIDLEKIFQKAKDNSIALEVNAFPSRLDLNSISIRSAVDLGVKLSVNTDAHTIDQLRFMEFGVAQARRGWAEKKDIINTWGWKKLEKFLGK